MTQDYKHDEKLFTKDGKPLIFFLRPCAAKSTIRPLVEHGGGSVISKFVPDAIKLAVEGDYITLPDYISTKYILECVELNTLLDKDKYIMKRQRERRFSSGNIEELGNVSDDLSPSSSITMETREYKRRQKYTNEEDLAMIKYIVTEDYRSAMLGKQLYKDMALLEITKHSAESMSCRIRKIILPNIRQYDISDKWRAYLAYSSTKDSGVKKVVHGNSFSKSQRQLTFNKSVPSAAPPNTNKSARGHSSIEIDSSDDEFDKILIDNSKLSKHFDELNNSSGRTVLQAADWSNSIAEVGKNGVVSKSKVDKKSENQKLCRIDPPSGSDTNDDELDASLMSYAVNVNSGDDEKAKQKKNVSPGKTSSPINSLDRKKKDKMELELQPTAASSPKNHSVTEINKTRHSQKISRRNKRTKISHVAYIMDDDEDQAPDISDVISDGEVIIQTEVQKFNGILSRLGELYGLFDEELYHLLRRHDGNVTETMRFIETGQSKLTWDSEDDEAIEQNLTKLNKKYGEKRVMSRAAFLEGV